MPPQPVVRSDPIPTPPNEPFLEQDDLDALFDGAIEALDTACAEHRSASPLPQRTFTMTRPPASAGGAEGQFAHIEQWEAERRQESASNISYFESEGSGRAGGADGAGGEDAEVVPEMANAIAILNDLADNHHYLPAVIALARFNDVEVPRSQGGPPRKGSHGFVPDMKRSVYCYEIAANSGLYPDAQLRMGRWLESGLHGIILPDPRRALELYQAASDADPPSYEAMCCQARCLEIGLGLEGGRKDPVTALWLYRKAAEGGYAPAQFELAYCLHHGVGTEKGAKDMKQAVAWYKKAAAAGDPAACDSLAALYMEGVHVDRDVARAVRLFERAADRGNMYSLNQLGVFYENGDKSIGGKRDLERAQALYNKAANLGYSSAQFNLANLLRTRSSSSMPLAIQWYKRASDQRHPQALMHLADLYQSGEAMPHLPKDPGAAARLYALAADRGCKGARTKLAAIKIEEDDYEAAVPLLKKAAAERDPAAFHRLGLLYESGLGVRKDKSRAIELHEVAAKAGHAAAMAHLADLLSSHDVVSAAGWYERAADAGHATAMTSLAVLYFKGYGSQPRDPVKAVSLLERAAGLNDASALNELADCLRTGRGVGKDERRAVELYRRAAAMGLASAMNNLGACHEFGVGGCSVDPAAAFGWYRKASDLGLAVGSYSLALCLEHGTGVERDPAAALRLYNRAAEGGHSGAMFRVGQCYERGSLGCNVDLEQSVEWYQKAAEQKDPDAACAMAFMYATGKGVVKDLSKAKDHYLRAAEKGNRVAENALGWFYENGLGGLRKDPDMAVGFYKRAAEKGEVNALFNLGECAWKGLGSKRDKAKAAEYWQRASEAGHMQATEALKKYKVRPVSMLRKE
ncbi:hypothetical protein HK101_003702 [Irineochytrium annulatum]|nr:hypothetical protein HK101_003702 [Irineochytrium annulatum]